MPWEIAGYDDLAMVHVPERAQGKAKLKVERPRLVRINDVHLRFARLVDPLLQFLRIPSMIGALANDFLIERTEIGKVFCWRVLRSRLLRLHVPGRIAEAAENGRITAVTVPQCAVHVAVFLAGHVGSPTRGKTRRG